MRMVLEYMFLGILIIVIDQYSKLWVLQLPASVQILSFLILEPVYNAGISWGMLQEQTITQAWLMLLIALVIVGLLFYIIRRMKQKHWIVPEVLILAGAISNFIDRIRYGAVIDFIRFFGDDWAFPYFNIADISIVVGVIGMLVYTMYVERHELV